MPLPEIKHTSYTPHGQPDNPLNSGLNLYGASSDEQSGETDWWTDRRTALFRNTAPTDKGL